VLALATDYDLNQIYTARQISATVLNISGRQRMLTQRSALLSWQFIYIQDQQLRADVREDLHSVIELLEKSHDGLIGGDVNLQLSGQLSPTIHDIYFQAPLHLDRQIRDYIAAVQALLQSSAAQLTQDNQHLHYITKASATDLLVALDAVVNQYQIESDREQLAIDAYQAQLYRKSRAAQNAAQAQASKLEKTLLNLQQTQAQLIHAEKMSSLGQMVAGLAHEINNPVNFIHGNLIHAGNYVADLLMLLQLYQQAYPQTSSLIESAIETIDLDFLLLDLPKVMSSMKIGADRIYEIVNSLRNFSRVNDSPSKAVDLHEGIESTLLILQNRLKPYAKYPGVTIVKEYGDLPLVECYAGQMNQVFMNIISNAIDALEESFVNNNTFSNEKLQIRICTQVIGEQAIVQIIDNGSGMTETVQKQLFDPFFTTKDVSKGTGLGLAISYKIVVETHGGVLKCKSALQQGTEFWIAIPLQLAT